jgi:predicted O-linked N-acetylglucosamine transferase (SPINDLY family)
MARSRSPVLRTLPQNHLDIAEVVSRAGTFEAGGDLASAIQTYREWLRHAAKWPHAWVGFYNLGVLLSKANDLDGARDAYAASLKQKPNHAPTLVNLGSIHEREARFDDAVACWKSALALCDQSDEPDPKLLSSILNNLGRRFDRMDRFPEALKMYTRCLGLQPDNEDLLYHWIYVRQHICEWPIHADLPGISHEQMLDATSPVALLAISDDPALQLRAAIHHRVGPSSAVIERLSPASGYTHERLRIGYLSSNFGAHAVSVLTAQLYELHDRSRFEIYGFCWSPEDNSALRERVRNGMDHFIRINEMSDEEAARAIRETEIDILIDLQGQTRGARPSILAYKPAPVQIAYLGFPATCGMPEIDYILADRYVLPEESAQYFTEKPLYLPDCFQINDNQRKVGASKNRSEYGLPDGAFVFCSFNKNTKFNPGIFSAWMRILQRTPNSVLWLLAADERTRENLSKHAERHGITSERLVFAPRVPLGDYLAQYAAADLFLDISPFNGGTTVADALWMALPVLTLSGRSFASRMGGSLLHAIGLPELITTDLDAYESLAVELGNEPDKLQALKAQLIKNKSTCPLFDSAQFTRHLEDIFSRVALSAPVPVVAASPKPMPISVAGSDVAERRIYFVFCAPAFEHASGDVYAMHAMAEDMYALGCNVGMLATLGMPGSRVPLITADFLGTVRANGMMIVAIYPESVTDDVLKADYAVWWQLNYPVMLTSNGGSKPDWADRVLSFDAEAGKNCQRNGELNYPLYDPDFFCPNDAIPKTETAYYVHRIFNHVESIDTPVQPTLVLNPESKQSDKQLREALWRSKVVISHEWSGTLVMAQLCGVPVILMPSPVLSTSVRYGGPTMPGVAWGYSEQSVEIARQSLAEVSALHRMRKLTWPQTLLAEVREWIAGVKAKS